MDQHQRKSPAGTGQGMRRTLNNNGKYTNFPDTNPLPLEDLQAGNYSDYSDYEKAMAAKKKVNPEQPPKATQSQPEQEHTSQPTTPPRPEETEKGPTLADFEYLRVNEDTPILEPDPIIIISGQRVGMVSDVITFSGESKGGKSAGCGFVISRIIAHPGHEFSDGFDMIEVKPNHTGKAVIVFDTEQSRYQYQSNIKATLRRAGLEVSPVWLYYYNIRQLPLDQYQAVTTAIIEAAAQRHGGIHSLFIDGIADYVTDVNQTEESNQIVRFFEHIAIRHNTVVACVIHTNPNSMKERGNLGSQLQRKSGSVLSVQKDDLGKSLLFGKLLRYGDEKKIEIMFEYCTQKGYHVAMAPKTKNEIETGKAAAKISSLEHMAKELMSLQALEYGQVIDKIMIHRACSERSAKTDFSLMRAAEIVTQGPDKLWRYNGRRDQLSLDQEGGYDE